MTGENGLPKGWVETTLGEVVVLCSTKIPTTKINLNNYISTENMLSDKGGVTISNALPNTLNVNHYKINDTLFSNIRTYFKKVWHADREGGASNDVLIFRPKNNKIFDHKFLYYHISSDNFIDFTVKTARGTKMPRGDKNAIINLKIFIPQEISEQKAIASILTSFDDKIELLQAQNETLENIAQTIFKEWFGKYQVGDELPEGWRVGKIDSVTIVVGGTTPSTKNPEYWGGSFHWTSPKDLSNSRDMFLLNTEKKITKEGLMKISSGLLPIGTLLLSSRAPIGYLSITTLELAINQGYIALIPGQYFSNSFMYLWLKLNMKTIENVANGSTFLEISKSSFRNIECVIPEKDVLKKLDKIIIPIFDKILSNLIQIQTLQQTRDTLLPKLMSGQLRVNEFKERICEVV